MVRPSGCDDGDGDGYGSPGDLSCPAGWADDCDDGDPGAFPGAPEQCNGLDDDCDGRVDEGVWSDADGDGFTPCGGPSGEPDCNDLDPEIHPGADEVCDGADSDCDGVWLDEELDLDADGHITCDDGSGVVDCDDDDPDVHPGADEIPYDGLDQDCDGADLTDIDGDGYDGGPDGEDCDDVQHEIHPGAIEICFDAADNDCNGFINEADCGELQETATLPPDASQGGCLCTWTASSAPGEAPAFARVAIPFVALILRLRGPRSRPERFACERSSSG